MVFTFIIRSWSQLKTNWIFLNLFTTIYDYYSYIGRRARIWLMTYFDLFFKIVLSSPLSPLLFSPLFYAISFPYLFIFNILKTTYDICHFFISWLLIFQNTSFINHMLFNIIMTNSPSLYLWHLNKWYCFITFIRRCFCGVPHVEYAIHY